MKRTRLPSGKNRGELSFFSPPMNSVGGADPSAGTTQISALRRPDSSAVVVRTKSTRRPSGESCGSLMRIALIKSSIAIARFVCAPAISGSEITITRAKTRTAGLWPLLSDIVFPILPVWIWLRPLVPKSARRSIVDSPRVQSEYGCVTPLRFPVTWRSLHGILTGC